MEGVSTVKKGTFGYINHYKKIQLINTLIWFGIAIAVFLFGYFMNDHSKQNIFSILAVLVILPAAKKLVGYIIFLPFHSVNSNAYEVIESKLLEGDHLYTDMVFTSPEKVMNLSYLIVTDYKIIGLTEYRKSDEGYIRDYLQKLIDGRSLHYKVIITKDYQSFLNELNTKKENTTENKDYDELHNIIMSILA